MIIFIAEDDISLQKSLSRILISLGHQVKVFSNGEQLLEALEQSNKSELIGNCCILLDFDLPKMNGLEWALLHKSTAAPMLRRNSLT